MLRTYFKIARKFLLKQIPKAVLKGGKSKAGSLCGLLVILPCVGMAEAKKASDQELWLVNQEFVRFGKRDVYEQLKRERAVQWSRFAKREKGAPVLALQVLDSPQYIYLVPVKDFGGVGRFLELEESFRAEMAQKNGLANAQMLATTLNFDIRSIYEYLMEYSHIHEGSECSLINRPHAKFFIYALPPENDASFREQLKKKAKEMSDQRPKSCHHAIRGVIGGDSPKYVVALCAKTKEELEGDIEAWEQGGISKELLRSKKDADAEIRLDLSAQIFPSSDLSLLKEFSGKS